MEPGARQANSNMLAARTADSPRASLTECSSVLSRFDTSYGSSLHRHNIPQGADDMKPFWIKAAKTTVALCVLFASGAASASSSKLTPNECTLYPFKPHVGPV